MTKMPSILNRSGSHWSTGSPSGQSRIAPTSKTELFQWVADVLGIHIASVHQVGAATGWAQVRVLTGQGGVSLSAYLCWRSCESYRAPAAPLTALLQQCRHHRTCSAVCCSRLQMGNGSLACHILDAYVQDAVPMHKVGGGTVQ